ncbi:MAG: RluA family pseudouridine synthase [Pseudomonadota bacterium]
MEDPSGEDADVIRLDVPETAVGQRLDKALGLAATDVPGLSRSRIASLILEGALEDADGRTVSDVKRKVKAGEVWFLTMPQPLPAEPEPENIPLEIVHEDTELIVVNKPTGMVVHPAPGSETGTLVNALLYHCGDELLGIGGERRPGIVHRIDKDTSGLLVVAKTQAAHAGLAALFASHDIDRLYRAICWGEPTRHDPRIGGLGGVSLVPDWIRIETRIGRHRADRKRMAVLQGPNEGRNAVTYLRTIRRIGPASLIECRLETGRTHQIRVHASYLGHALIGDPVYGRKAAGHTQDATVSALRVFPRQALHAAVLGFKHPISGKNLRFEVMFPKDLKELMETCDQQKPIPR